MWNPHSGYMGFIQDQSWGCLQGAFTNWKAQQQAAGQWKSLDPLTVHFLVPHRKGTLVEVTVRVWMAKTIMRTAWTGTWEQKSSSKPWNTPTFIYLAQEKKTIEVTATRCINSDFTTVNQLVCSVQQWSINAFAFTTLFRLTQIK